jgi:hypothetical protein
MREVITVDVHEGGELQVVFRNQPVGRPIAIPSGLKSITLVVRDTESVEEAKKKRAARLDARRRAVMARRRRPGVARDGADD